VTDRDDGVFIGEVRKNASEVVVVRQTWYEGHDLVDVRVFVVDAEGQGHQPTRKGVCAKPATWRALLPVIAEALGEEVPGDDEESDGDEDDG